MYSVESASEFFFFQTKELWAKVDKRDPEGPQLKWNWNYDVQFYTQCFTHIH